MCHMVQLKKQMESHGRDAQLCHRGDAEGQHGDTVSQSKQPTSPSRLSYLTGKADCTVFYEFCPSTSLNRYLDT